METTTTATPTWVTAMAAHAARRLAAAQASRTGQALERRRLDDADVAAGNPQGLRSEAQIAAERKLAAIARRELAATCR